MLTTQQLDSTKLHSPSNFSKQMHNAYEKMNLTAVQSFSHYL